MTHSVVIRADGSQDLGHGHVFRTLALADELKRRGHRVVYVCRDLPGAPFERIEAAGFSIVRLDAALEEPADAAATARVASERRCAWVIVDRYATTTASYAVLSAVSAKILAIDDLCAQHLPVDVLVNQNTNATTLPYQTQQGTVRLLGPRYALLRPAYREARPARPRPVRPVRRILLFMGGGDAGDATGKLLAALAGISSPPREIDVVVGAAYAHCDTLAAAAQASPHSVTIHRDLPDLVEVMTRADVAIAAGGSVTWELCCLGVPMLLSPIAKNQESVVGDLTTRGAAAMLGTTSRLTIGDLVTKIEKRMGNPALLAQYGLTAWNLVDGRGTERVAASLERASASVKPTAERSR